MYTVTPTTAAMIATMLTPWAGDDVALSRDARFGVDLLMDSLDVLTLISEAEDTFAIEIGDAEMQDISTLGDLIDLVEAKLTEREGRADG